MELSNHDSQPIIQSGFVYSVIEIKRSVLLLSPPQFNSSVRQFCLFGRGSSMFVDGVSRDMWVLVGKSTARGESTLRSLLTTLASSDTFDLTVRHWVLLVGVTADRLNDGDMLVV